MRSKGDLPERQSCRQQHSVYRNFLDKLRIALPGYWAGTQEDDRASMFGLLRFFSIASALAFFAVGAALVVFERHHEFRKLVEAVERQDVGLARSFTNVIWPQYSDYAESVPNAMVSFLRARKETSDIHKAVLRLTAGLPVLRVKIYRRDGITLYSSESSQVGKLKINHLAHLASARGGIPQSMLEHRHTFSSVAGLLVHRDIVESYLPIWGPDGVIEGVLEIYTDVSQDLAQIELRILKTGMVVSVVFLTLYAILFLIVKRADHVVRRQYGSLLRSRESINEKNDALRREISERERLAKNVKNSERRLRKLSDRLLYVQEEERTRISRELHDGIGQGLTDIKLRVERAVELCGNRQGGVGEILGTIVPAVQNNMDEVRRISTGLRPSILDDLGILATLSWSCREFRTNHPEIEVVQDKRVREQDVPDAIKTTIYRTLQEGLNNVVKHSNANRVCVCLLRKGKRIHFTVADNGRSIAVCRATQIDSDRPRLGLVGLQERAAMSGGSFSIRSGKSCGTKLCVTWPMPFSDAKLTRQASRALRQTQSGRKRCEGRAFS